MTRMIIAAALAAFIITPAARAADAPPRAIVVTYGDLNLHTSAGRAELENRVQTAASTICGPHLTLRPDSEPSIREHQILYRACVGRVTRRAMSRVVF